MSLQAEYYSDKSIAVFGETKPFSAEMKTLGGKFNYNLGGRPGWIFPKSKETELMQFIANVNAGLYQPQPVVFQQTIAQAPIPQPTIPQPAMSPRSATVRLINMQPTVSQVPTPFQHPQISIPNIPQMSVPRPNSPAPTGVNVQVTPSSVTYPNVFTAADGQSYQIIMYTVPLPKVGQKVDIVINDNTTSYQVEKVPNHPVDSMILTKLDDSTTTVGNLVSGKWQIPSITERHDIIFRNESDTKL